MKFCANISTLFAEFDFLDRFSEARNSGFNFIEMQSPYAFQERDIMQHARGMKCVLINSYTDNSEFGYAAIYGKEVEFCKSLSRALSYHRVLNFPKIHILAGYRKEGFTEDEQLQKFVDSLDSATECLEDNNIMGLIEPICPEVIENYFLNSYDLAIKALDRTSNSNVKLLLDIYHLHKITGDVKGNLEKYYPYAGHIQISQDPDRTEPFYPGGKIDYDYVFKFLKEKNYQGFIGLEYFPTGSTADSLEWIKKYE